MWQHFWTQIHVLEYIADFQVILFQTQSIHFKKGKFPYWFFQLMDFFLTHLFTDSSSFWVQGDLTTICLPLNSKLRVPGFGHLHLLFLHVLPTPVSASEDFTNLLISLPTQLDIFPPLAFLWLYVKRILDYTVICIARNRSSMFFIILNIVTLDQG